MCWRSLGCKSLALRGLERFLWLYVGDEAATAPRRGSVAHNTITTPPPRRPTFRSGKSESRPRPTAGTVSGTAGTKKPAKNFLRKYVDNRAK